MLAEVWVLKMKRRFSMTVREKERILGPTGLKTTNGKMVRTLWFTKRAGTEGAGERIMNLIFIQLLSFHTSEETYLYRVSVFSISENPLLS